MDVVYATATIRVVTEAGGHGIVQKGTHWPADDPIVLAHPDAFSTDPRYGMCFSRKPAGYDDPPAPSVPPVEPVEQTTRAPGEQRARTSRRAS